MTREMAALACIGLLALFAHSAQAQLPASGSISTPPECTYTDFQGGCMNLDADWTAECKLDPDTTGSDPKFVPDSLAIFVRRQDQPVDESVFIASFPDQLSTPAGQLTKTTTIVTPDGDPVVDDAESGYLIELRAAEEVCIDEASDIGTQATGQTTDFYTTKLDSSTVSGRLTELTGVIGVPQFPCTLPGPEHDTRCETQLTLSGTGDATFCLWRAPSADTEPALISCGADPNRTFTWDFTTLEGTGFEYRAHADTPEDSVAGFESGQLLDEAFVRATSGSISVVGDGCTIAAGEESCDVDLEWAANNAPGSLILALADDGREGSIQPETSPVTIALGAGQWHFELLWSNDADAPLLDSAGPISVDAEDCVAPPAGPNLVKPEGVLAAGTDPVVFEWSAVADVDGYRLRVRASDDDSNDDSTLVVDKLVTTTGHEQAAVDFEPGVEFTWEVWAQSEAWCRPAKSDTLEFRIDSGDTDPKDPPDD